MNLPPKVEFFSSDSQQIKFDSSLVLHTEQFLKRWCPNHAKSESQKVFATPRRVPNVAEYKDIAALPVDDKWRMLALSGAGAFDPTLDPDPTQPTYTQWVHDKMLANKVGDGFGSVWGEGSFVAMFLCVKKMVVKCLVVVQLVYRGSVVSNRSRQV